MFKALAETARAETLEKKLRYILENEDLEEFVLDSCKNLECKGNDLNS